MAILILNSARNTSVPYDVWLRDLNEPLLLLCSTKQPAADDAYSFVKRFENYEVNGCVEAAALELFKERKFHTVVAKAEADLLRAGKLRDVLGIKGQSWESALAYRDKTVMKSYTTGAGIPTPAYRRLDTAFDLLDFVESNGYPVFVKPVGGSGAIDTDALRDRADLERFLAAGLPAGMEVEELIEGEMYHVDGIVIGGRIVIAHPSLYTNGGCLAFKEDKACGSYMLGRDNPLYERLRRFTGEVIAALPSPEDFTFHAEIFHTPDDRLVFCEIASRTGGARINETMRRALNVDLDELWIKAQCGVEIDVEALRARVAGEETLGGWLVVPPRNGVLESIPAAAPAWVAEYKQNSQPGTDYRASYTRRKAGDYIAAVVVRGRSEAEVRDNLTRAAQWIEGGVGWSLA